MSDFSALPHSFYEPSALTVAPKLLGHYLIRSTPSGVCGGLIVETEAYLTNDPACHAYRRETPRNRTMWSDCGRAYVYFIYGRYSCFNAVCRPPGIAEAVLVRAVEPRFGLEQMQQNRAAKTVRDLTNGPGKLCDALRIDRSLDTADLCDSASPLFIARNANLPTNKIVVTTRIGITQAADWPLRYFYEGNNSVSRKTIRGHEYEVVDGANAASEYSARWLEGALLPYGTTGHTM